MLQRLRTGLEVGHISRTVQELKTEKKQSKKENQKPLSYAEVVQRGVSTRTPTAPRGVVAWSTSRMFFLRPEDETTWTKEIPAWIFGAKLRQKFGVVQEGGDPPLLRLHCMAHSEWQMLVSTWVRDQLIEANQNCVDFQEFGSWILERREVLSGPSAVILRVPLELSDVEIQQGLVEGSRSLLEPQFHEIMKAVRVQQLKRREVSAEGPHQIILGTG